MVSIVAVSCKFPIINKLKYTLQPHQVMITHTHTVQRPSTEMEMRDGNYAHTRKARQDARRTFAHIQHIFEARERVAEPASYLKWCIVWHNWTNCTLMYNIMYDGCNNCTKLPESGATGYFVMTFAFPDGTGEVRLTDNGQVSKNILFSRDERTLATMCYAF